MARILILGTGGREHALAWRCVHEGHEVHTSPGSDALATFTTRHRVGASDRDGVVALARELAVDLVVVGPEQPLVDGVADVLRAAGIAVFGPNAAAAELEGSKAAAKAFMVRHGIPTARHVTVTNLEEGLAAVRTFEVPPVVKASGLASGKGVVVAETYEEAEETLRACLAGGRFGSAGETVVLEQRLVGEELSFFAMSDGERVRTFPAAQDHKRLRDGDQGPNTGGMGAYVPAPRCTPAVEEAVIRTIVEPTIAGLRSEGRPFVGVLFVGLMIAPDDTPWVIEYNVRFGDPEAQPLMFALREPVVPHLLAAARGALEPGRFTADAACTVVLAAEGYPDAPKKGARIAGLERLQGREDVLVFHAGTRQTDDGAWLVDGGRVLGICARGGDLQEAIGRAHAAADEVCFDGLQRRRDIGFRALPR
jgi:phosphoribosylamine--glycine ligase